MIKLKYFQKIFIVTDQICCESNQVINTIIYINPLFLPNIGFRNKSNYLTNIELE